MCFSAEVSITTYVIGMLGCLQLWRKNLKPESLFYLCVIQMQLIEFFLWKNNQCNDFNKSLTKIAIIINHIQPIILWFAILYFNKNLPNWIQTYMIIFTLITISYTSYVFTDDCTVVTKKSYPHLQWNWNNAKYNNLYYFIFLLALSLLSIYGLDNGNIHAIIMVFSFYISYLIYNKNHSVGSMWCFLAASVPWIISSFY